MTDYFKLVLLFIMLAITDINSQAAAIDKFYGQAMSIPAAVKNKMLGHSWHKGCPIDFNDLRYLKLSYWGYDDKPHYGELIIHRTLAQETLEIFKELYYAKFPIQEMKIYDTYPNGEYAKHNDTVGFYCRTPMDKSKDKFSSHAYGYAIDINPLINPYIYESTVYPREAYKFIASHNSMSDIPKGMITDKGLVVSAFISHGWQWGGSWHDEKDYMHFQKANMILHSAH